MAASAAETRRTVEAKEQAFEGLRERLCRLSACLDSVAPPAPPAPKSVPVLLQKGVATPNTMKAIWRPAMPFVVTCSLLFSLQPHMFLTEAAKVAYIITHLTGRGSGERPSGSAFGGLLRFRC